MSQSAGSATEAPELKTGDMLCPCYEFTVGDLMATLKANPTIEFDDVLKSKNIGNKCTACMLDLEYYYIELSRRLHEGREAGFGDGGAKKKSAQKVPLKQKIYGFVDRISPAVHPPEHTNYYLPVIRGQGAEQYVWIANRSFLFENKVCAPAMTVELTVRDDHGKLRYRGDHRLEQDSHLRLNVSQHLPEPAAGVLSVGSVRIARKADKPGVRGTTRPQIEIVGTAGAACVHGQAPSPTPGWKQTFLCRPEEERVFLATVNASSKPMQLELKFPLDLLDKGDSGRTTKVELAPYGATLQEVVLTADERKRFHNLPFSVYYASPSRNKTYVLCSNPQLTAFSVDHA